MPKIILAANTDWFLYNFRYALMHNLRARGFEVVLVSPDGKFVQRLREDGFQWYEWRLKRRSITPWLEVGSFFRLWQIYRREKPDIIHHHTIKAVLYGSLAAALSGIALVANSISGLGYVFSSTDPKAVIIRKMIHPFYRRVLRKISSAVIFENQSDREYFFRQKYVYPQQTWLIEGVGADPRRFSPTPEPDGEVVILMAARTLWDKGVGVFVDAARFLKARVGVRMVLVGEPDPGNPKTLEKGTLNAWHNQKIIEWWGWQQDMERVYRQSNIVVLPTMYGEGLPTTLIEAAACGRPIVATDVPGCRAIVHHNRNGLLIPQNDAPALAEAIEKLVRNPELRKRMGARGRQIVLEKFTHEKINRTTLDVYHHLLESYEME